MSKDDEFITPDGTRLVAVDRVSQVLVCHGCVFTPDSTREFFNGTVHGTNCLGAPPCTPNSRGDGRTIVWAKPEAAL